LRIYGSTESRPTVRNRFAGSSRFSLQPSAFSLSAKRAFTLLELMLVIGIIGLLAALAMPLLSGFTKGNAMKAATLQLLDDVALARQRAMANRSMVCMVFLPANFWTNDRIQPSSNSAYSYFANQQITNLAAHQYAAYALISMRTVGDQPGVSNVHYLTDWRFLPQGVYISPFQFTNGNNNKILVSTTNTTLNVSNGWSIAAFTNNIWFPFPSTFVPSYGTTFGATNCYNLLPYIGFSASGQLTAGAGNDQFIMLTSGSIFCPLDPRTLLPQIRPIVPPNLVETPPGNATNNPNLIHIDWLTARARIERNQF
jgi:prepilin-type N-terminal cleavage/methylation domain-containing protein